MIIRTRNIAESMLGNLSRKPSIFGIWVACIVGVCSRNWSSIVHLIPCVRSIINVSLRSYHGTQLEWRTFGLLLTFYCLLFLIVIDFYFNICLPWLHFRIKLQRNQLKQLQHVTIRRTRMEAFQMRYVSKDNQLLFDFRVVTYQLMQYFTCFKYI